MTQKRTPWFPGEVKPVHFGLFERRYPGGIFLSFWDAQNWLDGPSDLCGLSMCQSLPWRGLARKAW